MGTPTSSRLGPRIISEPFSFFNSFNSENNRLYYVVSGVRAMYFPSKRDVGLGLFIPAAGDHGLWLWRAGTYPLDKGHMMERHFLAGKLRRKA
jgi:hypothetical protein